MITALDPRSGTPGAEYPETTDAELEAILAAAAAARDHLGVATAPARVTALRGLAIRLQADAGELIASAMVETGLGEARLTGELERTWRQIQTFADRLAGGGLHEGLIERSDPAARPVPRPDLRRMLVPRGPVAVYGASNFPFAFGVAGGDTASALAAGCPVVAKGHPGHPGTSVRFGVEIAGALADAGLAPGWFGLIQTASVEMSLALVDDDRIEAVAFTGSQSAGRALFDACAARLRPIPVYAEMGSTNPVILTAGAIAERGAELADLLAAAVTANAGQLCTKPGLIFAPAGSKAFISDLGSALAAADPGPMLGPRLRDGAARGDAELDAHAQVRSLARGRPPGGSAVAVPGALYCSSAEALAKDPTLADERFGPIALVVLYDDVPELLAALRGLPGQLTATLHVASEATRELESAASRQIAEVLIPRVGRLVVNGVPTGVSVSDAMHHGGPYPASTNGAYTSVGTDAVRRFLRPVVWQNAPQWLLPEPLRDDAS